MPLVGGSGATCLKESQIKDTFGVLKQISWLKRPLERASEYFISINAQSGRKQWYLTEIRLNAGDEVRKKSAEASFCSRIIPLDNSDPFRIMPLSAIL